MIVVTVELVSALDGHRETLGTALIGNDGGSKNARVGSYNAYFWAKRLTKEPWRQGRVEGFPRKRLNAWHLIYRALDDVIGGKR